MKKAPAPITIQDAFQITNQQFDSTKPAKFQGTDNPRYLRVIHALLQRPRRREDVDSIAGCSNGPDLIAALRALGLDKDKHLPVQRIKFLDRDGNVCRPGIYSLTDAGKRLIWAWQARCRKGGATA